MSPGYVTTDIFENCNMPDLKRQFEKRPALVPEDIADAVIYALGTPPHVQVDIVTIEINRNAIKFSE